MSHSAGPARMAASCSRRERLCDPPLRHREARPEHDVKLLAPALPQKGLCVSSVVFFKRAWPPREIFFHDSGVLTGFSQDEAC